MAEVEALQNSLSEQAKIKLMLQNAKGRLVESGRRRDTLAEHVKVTKTKLLEEERAREALFRGFETTILSVQSKIDRKNLMLSKRLDGYEAEAEGCEAKIEQMVGAMELDRPTVLETLSKTARMVKSSDDATAETRYAISRGVKVP